MIDLNLMDMELIFFFNIFLREAFIQTDLQVTLHTPKSNLVPIQDFTPN